MTKGKGKRKMEETSNERWTDHIIPDSRRRKQRVLTAGEDGESGEDFDFASVDLMESSEDEDVPLHGQHEVGHPKTPILITGNERSFQERSHREKYHGTLEQAETFYCT